MNTQKSPNRKGTNALPDYKRQELIKAHAGSWSKYLSELAEYVQTAEYESYPYQGI